MEIVPCRFFLTLPLTTMSLLLACVYQSGGERRHTAGFHEDRTHKRAHASLKSVYQSARDDLCQKRTKKKKLADQRGSSLIAAESFKSLAAYYSFFFPLSYLTNGSIVIS